MLGLDLSGATGATLDGRYRLVSLLGVGGMGQIYEGTHLSLDRKVAIKVLPSHLSVDHRFRARFAREARAVARIAHRNVVQIMDFGESPDGPVYFVMEFLEGRDLGTLLRETGRLPWPRARRLLLQAVSALKAAHAHGIIHRDIKPGNCFLVDLPHEGLVDVVKLLDFGIAKVSSELENEGETLVKPLTGTGEIMGTASYMAPEQARGEPLDARSDVYSLGIMAYEMLTGRVPFAGVNPFHVVTRHLHDRPEPLHRWVPDIQRDVEAIVLRAIAKEPEDRFQSMGELEAAIMAVEDATIDSFPTLVRARRGPPEHGFEDAETPDPIVLMPRLVKLRAEAKPDRSELTSPPQDARLDESEEETEPTRIRPATDLGIRYPSVSANEQTVTEVGSTVVMLASAPAPLQMPIAAPVAPRREGSEPRASASRGASPRHEKRGRRTLVLGLGILLASATGIAAVTLLNGPEPRAAVDAPVMVSERSEPEAPVEIPVVPAEPSMTSTAAVGTSEETTTPVIPPRREQLEGTTRTSAADHETKPAEASENVDGHATDPSTAVAKPATPTAAPAARPSKRKRYDTEDCKYHRERAHLSSNAGDHEEVIKLAAPGPCWSPGQRIERLRLYQSALSSTKRFADCVIVGAGIEEPTIKKTTDSCRDEL